MSPWLHEELKGLVENWGPLFEGPRRLSLQRVFELLVEHAKLRAPSVEFLRTFEFATRSPGRPRRSELESPAQPTDREVQLGKAEDRRRDADDQPN